MFAQQSQHYLKRFSVEEGLAHTTAGRMCEDQYGFIWICTEDGLSRFDGYGFKNYNHKQDDPNSLPANWCGELFRDKDGNLWVITSSNKISMYNPASDNFISYSPGASQYYRNVRHEKEKNKLIYCSEKSVFIFHFDSRQFELIYTDTLLTYLDAQIIDNTLLMLTSKGFHEYDLSKKKLTRIITGLKEIDSPLSTNFYPMLKPDSRGDIYIPSLKGIFRYNHKTRAVEYIKYIDTENGGRVELSSYTGAFFENDDILWIFSASKGAIRVDMTGKKRPVLYSDSPDTPIKYAINSNEVQNFYKDSKGKMIILTYRGININDENLGRFRFYAFNDDEKKSKTTEKYSFFLEDRNQNYYFSTSLDGIRIMENKKGFHDIVWLYDNFIRDMNITKGEYDKNIRILKENLTEIAIRDFLEDKTGNLWICTDFGVVFISKKDGSVGLISESTSPVKLFAEQPGDIIQHQDGSIWVLPFNGKVTKINADLAASQVIEMNPEMQPGIFHTYSGYFDKKNILWLGSTDQIVTYDLSSARAKSYRSNEILGNQAARFWLEPDDNTLLIGGTVRFIKLDRK
ncbi:MAG: hypothetical protein L6Q59_13530 [Ignavibacteriaceae bacterium]|nr:hypothetical protein [Ignavibacteriaceae bacterium]